ncbi:hypothetical protein [Sinomicrobium soli]|uniref:hypothetical protein n=1 Tax=Sinomicrobium sp. N-1-3-6 TaxID=2219864 RepID=UPI0011BF070C|nr:hypothetical protein [Sinomicrobium sp. N-1-3-6]
MKYLPVTIEALKRKSLKVAMDEYGAPLHVETFILDDALPESRIELLNHFSKEERQKASITLKETVWEKDNKTNITAWYREKDRQWVLVHAMEWKKGSEF